MRALCVCVSLSLCKRHITKKVDTAPLSMEQNLGEKDDPSLDVGMFSGEINNVLLTSSKLPSTCDFPVSVYSVFEEVLEDLSPWSLTFTSYQSSCKVTLTLPWPIDEESSLNWK